MKAQAEQLLARHGVLTRDAVAFEELPGGFSTVYPVLRALEEAGRVRRGYFVAGLGGLQFAHAGALERLRQCSGTAEEEPRAVVLAATDPANAYGVALPWPRGTAARLQRAAGAHVVLVHGALAAFLSGNGREVVSLLPDAEPDLAIVARAAAQALAAWAASTGRHALGWGSAPGTSLADGPLAPALTEAGFVRSGPGFRLDGSAEGSRPVVADEARPSGERRSGH
jgi:ATP-dependent Lhr-like helicase